MSLLSLHEEPVDVTALEAFVLGGCVWEVEAFVTLTEIGAALEPAVYRDTLEGGGVSCDMCFFNISTNYSTLLYM